MNVIIGAIRAPASNPLTKSPDPWTGQFFTGWSFMHRRLKHGTRPTLAAKPRKP